MKHRAAIVLGSNIDPDHNVPAALAALTEHPALEIVARSSLYHTQAVGPPGQPPFVNAAIVVETNLGPEEVRSELRTVEASLGRVRSGDKFAPRPIDLDLVLFDDLAAEFEGWRLPDPELEQPHVLVPLAEIAPDWIIPGRRETVGELAEHADRSTLHG